MSNQYLADDSCSSVFDSGSSVFELVLDSGTKLCDLCSRKKMHLFKAQ